MASAYDMQGNDEMMRQRALAAQMASKPAQGAVPAAGVAGAMATTQPVGSPVPGPGLNQNTGIVSPSVVQGGVQSSAPKATGLDGVDTSKFDTDGYAMPGLVKQVGNRGTLPGWDANKLSDPNHQTPKYVVGRILSNYPDTPDGLKAAVPDIQQAYPGSTLVGDDKLNIPGVGTVDVGVSFGSGGGKGWAWQTGDGGGGSKAGGAAGGGMANPFADLGGMTNQSTYSKLMQRMGQLSPELTNQSALMSLLTQ